MDIQLLLVPFDSGNRNARMGAGPERLLDVGLERTLRESGHNVTTRIAHLASESWQAEIQTSFELMRMLATAVGEAQESHRFPIILAGNCSTAVGTVAGLGARSTGVAWFDAHGDFNTPETTSSGFLDGTAVSILTGRCWTQLAATVPGFTPVADERVCLIGTRDLDPLEGALLEASGVEVVEPKNLRCGLPAALTSIREHVDTIYVHLDLDVLDSGVARANSYALSGGLTLEDVEFALSEIARVFRIGAVTLSAYDPAGDTSDHAAKAAIGLISTAARVAERT